MSHYSRPIDMVQGLTSTRELYQGSKLMSINQPNDPKAWQHLYDSFSLVIVIRARRLCRIALVLVIVLAVPLALGF
jgi:hypothetical protein